jgi:hypothetical protein
MKKSILFILLLHLYSQAVADCSAPDLTFEIHNGPFLNFKITKLWDESQINGKKNARDTLIKFGDYNFLVSAQGTTNVPTKLNVNVSDITKRLLNNFKSSEYSPYPNKQIFTVSEIEAYDLTGDSKEDLIIFNVSPGANVYSGAVGILKGSLKTLIKPTCY